MPAGIRMGTQVNGGAVACGAVQRDVAATACGAISLPPSPR